MISIINNSLSLYVLVQLVLSVCTFQALLFLASYYKPLRSSHPAPHTDLYHLLYLPPAQPFSDNRWLQSWHLNTNKYGNDN